MDWSKNDIIKRRFIKKKKVRDVFQEQQRWNRARLAMLFKRRLFYGHRARSLLSLSIPV